MVLILKIFFLSFVQATCLYLPPFAKKKSFRIIQGFNGKYSHQPPLQYGIDLEMPVGTLIYSARGGTVEEVIDHHDKSGKDPSFIDKANKIIINHGDGTFALYAHLKKNSARVKKGQVIRRSFPIGRSGCTGWCDGPHLHFEIFKKNLSAKRRRESLPFKLGCQVPKLGSKITNEFPE